MKNCTAFFFIFTLWQAHIFAQGIGNQANLVTASGSMPLLVKENQTKTFHFKELKRKASCKSSKPNEVTMDMASNPIWFVIQALPYIIDDQDGSTPGLINSFFANSVALYLLNKEVGLDELMQKWEKDQGNSNEAKMHQRIGQMFDTVVINQRMADEITQLEKRQMPDGSWPWFPGMKGSRDITQRICCGIGRLFDLHVYDNYSDRLNNLGIPAFKYCDYQMNQEYQNMIDRKENLDENHVSSDILNYLYARTFWNIPLDYRFGKALFYWQQQAWTYWQDRSPLEQAMLVPIFYRQGEDTVYIKMLRRFEKDAIHSDEDGVYWKWNTGNETEQTETQAMLLEGYSIMRYPTPDLNTIEGMKQWLLRYREMGHWTTGAATLDAIYALLQKDNDPVLTDKLAEITMGDTHFDSTAGQGSGYLYHVWTGKDVNRKLGDIKIENKTNGSAWADVAMQYDQKPRSPKTKAEGLKITKEIYVLTTDEHGPYWKMVSGKMKLKMGDSIKVMIRLNSDNDLNFVTIHDPICGAFKTTTEQNGLQSHDGADFYTSVKDRSADFSFNNLEKGEYAIKYFLCVKQKGKFQIGTASLEEAFSREVKIQSKQMNLTVE